MYSITCIQRPPEGSNKSSLLQQVVFNCRFYLFDLRRSVVSQQCSLKAVDRFIQVVSDKGLTVFAIWARLLHLKWLKCFFSAVRIRFSKKKKSGNKFSLTDGCSISLRQTTFSWLHGRLHISQKHLYLSVRFLNEP